MGRDLRAFTHAYFQYPAMMVPAMQGDLLDALIDLNIGIEAVLDPFVGSGTVMTEAMLRGLHFGGQDVNPLAILLCRGKSGPFNTVELRKVIDLLYLRVSRRRTAVLHDFPGRDKWFGPGVAADLSNLANAIALAEPLSCRRFLWIALAETVRLVSNSRTSTVKLHIRPIEERAKRDEIDVHETFFGIAESNFERFAECRTELRRRHRLKGHQYSSTVQISLLDSSRDLRLLGGTRKYDVLVTSPPYGDNLSTIAYGQQAYLPLQWIPVGDIDNELDDSYLRTTQEIDRRGLGGTWACAAGHDNLVSRSWAYQSTIGRLASQPPDRGRRVAGFCRDLAGTIPQILGALNPNSYMFWTVGNRRVGGSPVPLDRILRDVLEHHGCTFVDSLTRTIPQSAKRMASRNQITSTMATETVLVLRSP